MRRWKRLPSYVSHKLTLKVIVEAKHSVRGTLVSVIAGAHQQHPSVADSTSCQLVDCLFEPALAQPGPLPLRQVPRGASLHQLRPHPSIVTDDPSVDNALHDRPGSRTGHREPGLEVRCFNQILNEVTLTAALRGFYDPRVFRLSCRQDFGVGEAIWGAKHSTSKQLTCMHTECCLFW